MRKGADIAAIAIVVLGAVRIASTYTTFSATVDEPMHISAGLQLYTQRTYSYQPENPPLPRLVLALAPWIGGMEFDPRRDQATQLMRVFHSNDRYETNLVLARAGNLIFFAIASIATWLWARRGLGATGGLLAVLIFTTQPVIAGYAGLATLDIAATAGVAVSLLAFVRWLDEPSLPRTLAFGAAGGFAILCKFSCIGYVPAACAAMWIVRRHRPAWWRIAPAFAATAMVVLIGYAFQIDWFFKGIAGLRRIESAGVFGYLFGEVSAGGWWYYFPVAIALKTTLASLILAVFGVRRQGRRFPTPAAEPPDGAALPRLLKAAALPPQSIAAALAILAVAMTSDLDLGVRYVLPLYVPLSVAAAAGALWLPRVIAIALLAWHVVASAAAHPDAFPYFHEGVRAPWRALLDSNLDWGQDVLRLREVAREKRISRIGLAVYGWHDFDALRFPPHYMLQRAVPSQGWVAVSEQQYGVIGGYEWLRGRRYERVGKSIRLYYIP